MTTASLKRRLKAVEPQEEQIKFIVTIGDAQDGEAIANPVRVRQLEDKE